MFTIVKYVNFRKAYNFVFILIGYYTSLLFKKVIILGNPYSITTEPTNLCNLNCPECPTGNKTSNIPKGKMDFTFYKKVIDEVKSSIIYQMLYFQGEPFLNPEIFKMIKYSDDNKIYTTLSTNGHFLSMENNRKIIQSGLKEILISVDGITQESFEKYRIGGNLNTVLNGIKNLIASKQELKSKYPKIIVQFLVFKHNEHEIKDIQILCKKLKVDKLELKSAQIYHPENSKFIPENSKYARYQQKDLQIKNKLKNRCFRVWSTLVVTWEGFIIPCCFDKYNHHVIGSISNKEAFLLWKSKQFNTFRHQILHDRKGVKICHNCTEGLKL